METNNSRFIRIMPRLVRLRDAPAYLGMDKNRFNEEVRPHLTEIPVGTQGAGFDRLDLDEWFDNYKLGMVVLVNQRKEENHGAKGPARTPQKGQDVAHRKKVQQR